MTSGIFLTSDSSFKLKAWRDSILAMIFVMINGCNSFLAFEALIRESKDLELFVGFPNIWSIKSASSLTLKLCFFIIFLKSVVSTNQTRFWLFNFSVVVFSSSVASALFFPESISCSVFKLLYWNFSFLRSRHFIPLNPMSWLMSGDLKHKPTFLDLLTVWYGQCFMFWR